MVGKKKTCTKCGETKSAKEFNKHKGRKDGLNNLCKICHRANVSAYQKTDRGREGQNKRNLKYIRSDKGVAARKRYETSESAREYQQSPARMIKKAINSRNYRHNHPQKTNAHNAIMSAIRSNKLPHVTTQTCTDCEKQAQHYHHESYDKKDWLNVIPLCVGCHNKRHRKQEKCA